MNHASPVTRSLGAMSARPTMVLVLLLAACGQPTTPDSDHAVDRPPSEITPTVPAPDCALVDEGWDAYTLKLDGSARAIRAAVPPTRPLTAGVLVEAAPGHWIRLPPAPGRYALVTDAIGRLWLNAEGSAATLVGVSLAPTPERAAARPCRPAKLEDIGLDDPAGLWSVSVDHALAPYSIAVDNTAVVTMTGGHVEREANVAAWRAALQGQGSTVVDPIEPQAGGLASMRSDFSVDPTSLAALLPCAQALQVRAPKHPDAWVRVDDPAALSELSTIVGDEPTQPSQTVSRSMLMLDLLRGNTVIATLRIGGECRVIGPANEQRALTEASAKSLCAWFDRHAPTLDRRPPKAVLYPDAQAPTCASELAAAKPDAPYSPAR